MRQAGKGSTCQAGHDCAGHVVSWLQSLLCRILSRHCLSKDIVRRARQDSSGKGAGPQLEPSGVCRDGSRAVSSLIASSSGFFVFSRCIVKSLNTAQIYTFELHCRNWRCTQNLSGRSHISPAKRGSSRSNQTADADCAAAAPRLGNVLCKTTEHSS